MISIFLDDLRKIIWSYQMIYLLFSVLILIESVIGEELNGADGAVYKYDRNKNRLGEGTFGEAIRGKKFVGNYSEPVAMKFEKIYTKKTTYVQHEKTFYHLLSGHPAIPKFHDCLRDKQGNAVLILELLGHNLQTIRKLHGGRFTIKTTMMIGCHLLNIMEYIHSKGVIFNDIKPDNFAVGYDNSSNIFILDFGISTFYLKNGEHIEPEKKPSAFARGTDSYMSVYAHNHQKLSRRDDIESIVYMLIEFLQGKLPWTYITAADNNERLNIIYSWKREMKMRNIVGDKCTNTLVKFLAYARRMKFTDQPDYNYLRQLLVNELNLRGLHDDKLFDWVKKKNIKSNDKEVAKANTAVLTTSEKISEVKKKALPIISNIIKSILQTQDDLMQSK